MQSANASILTPELLASRPVQVIERAVAQSRLAHALLVFGDDLSVLEVLAQHIAARLLDGTGDVLRHPDLFTLGPSGKARQIVIGKDANTPNTVRALIHDVQLSPVQSLRKVAILREVDRLNQASANAILKTLEEPPRDTTLILLTTRPYDLLPTIRSRCLNFRIPTGKTLLNDGEWQRWLTDYQTWLGQLVADRNFGKSRPADAVLPVYGLVTRFTGILKRLDDDYWKAHKDQLPESLESDQLDALKAGHFKMLRQKMMTEIEQRTRDAALSGNASGNKAIHYALAEAVRILEKCAGLLEVNFNAEAALEYFLLSSLRLWSRAAQVAV